VSEPMLNPATVTNNDDESFLTLEQECKMDSEVFIDRPRRKKTTIETHVTAVIMDEKMEEDYPEKKILHLNNNNMNNRISIGQQEPIMPKLLEQIDTIDLD
ncbi:unnamed protein product, partial [Rotaria sp. Silwood2]